MLKKYSLQALQKAMNHALNLDQEMPAKLQKLDGKTLEMVILPLDVHFFMQFKEGKLHLLDEYAQQADTIIHSSPIGLIRLSLLPSSKARSLFNDKIHISGDIEFGQDIKRLFDELDIDWEGHLAQFTGDVIAHQIGSFVRKSIEVKNHISDSLRQNISEFLHEELRACPSKNELNNFFEEVDELSLTIERLEAQVTLLMKNNEIH